MSKITDITALANGAHFFRADLHIHSYQSSHDVNDAGMTPAAIVRTAISDHLDIISITDHNEITNVEAAIKAASGSALLVVPGVELSTPQGHLLCYLPTLEALQKFHGRLNIAERGKQTSHCQDAMLDCLRLLTDLGGFGLLAHVDGQGGFDTVVTGGNTPHKLNILCHKALLGIELKSSSSVIAYSDADPDNVRSAAGIERIKRLNLGSRQWLARVLNSDAHALKALGRNAQGDKKVTRFKMDSPSFDGLRIALEDSDARVRIEEQVPPSIPYVVGIAAEGGFLDGLKVHFSPNLNCIIGGRGTGKSTTFEGVRCLIADAQGGDVVDSEIWPDVLHLFWQDQAGQQHPLDRAAQSDLVHVSDPLEGPTAFHIESYGQGETARISREANDNPIALLSYLDRFVDVARFEGDENTARDELLSLQSEIEKSRKNVERIPATERDLATKQQQLRFSGTICNVALMQGNLVSSRRDRQLLREIKACRSSRPAKIVAGDFHRAACRPRSLRATSFADFASDGVNWRLRVALTIRDHCDMRDCGCAETRVERLVFALFGVDWTRLCVHVLFFRFERTRAEKPMDYTVFSPMDEDGAQASGLTLSEAFARIVTTPSSASMATCA